MKIQCAIVDSIFWAAGKVPDRAALCLGRSLGWSFQHLFRLRRNVMQWQVATAMPHLDADERKHMLREIYRHIGLLFIEILRLPSMPKEKLLNICEFHGLENIDRALAKQRGLLVLSAHYGNWELGIAASARRGYQTHAIVKEIKGQLANYGVQEMRKAHGVSVLPRRLSIRQILQTLRSNEPVGFVLDQNTTSEEGVFVEFFGKPACTMPGLAVLAKRTGAPVVPLAFYRDDDGLRHHVVAYPEVPLVNAAEAEDDIRLNTQRFTHVLEELIRKHPAQWLWIHKRWRTQPLDAAENAAIAECAAACADHKQEYVTCMEH